MAKVSLLNLFHIPPDKWTPLFSSSLERVQARKANVRLSISRFRSSSEEVLQHLGLSRSKLVALCDGTLRLRVLAIIELDEIEHF